MKLKWLRSGNRAWMLAVAFMLTPIAGGTDANAKVDGVEVLAISSASPSIPGPVSVNSGGSPTGAFVADGGFSGGTVKSNGATIDTSLVTNPAPQAVYQSARYGTFSYTVSRLTASKSYKVNLHFTEDFETAAGRRLENVSINGTQVLSNFDIFAATGAQHKAIMKTFTATADANGNVAISFSPASGSTNTNAKVDGVEVLTAGSPPPPPPSGQIEDFQYLVGDWYLPDLVLPAAGTTGVPGASTIRCVPAGLRNKATINNVGTRVYTADSAGHLQFAIYTNGTNMRPANLVSTSTSMSLATAGVISSALSSQVQGGPGGANFTDTFWFCSNTDSTKATFSSVNTTTAFGQSIIGASTAGNVLQASGTGVVISHLSCSGSACNGGSSTYGTWPSSLAGTTWTEQTTIKMPMMAIQFVSVP